MRVPVLVAVDLHVAAVEEQLRTLLDAARDQIADAGFVFRRDQRADIGGVVETVADGLGRRLLEDEVGELVVDALLDDDDVVGETPLAPQAQADDTVFAAANSRFALSVTMM